MPQQPPDIIWIVADQLHHALLGYAGNPVVKTPNIDRLAAAGRIYENAYCQQPICMPSRSSFNTGYYPQETRVHNNPVQLPASIPTLADRLKEAGYRTAAFGHIGGDGLESRFDRHVDWWQTPLRQSMMAECDALLAGTERLPAHTCGVHPLPEEQLFDTLATDLAIEELGRGGSPLFLQLDLYRPHIPWFVPQKHLDLYDRETIPLPATWDASIEEKPTALRGAQVSTRMAGIPEAKMREALHHYYANISYVDAQVGRVLRALEERGNLENTAVFFFADHGEYAGEFGMIGKTRFLYECLTRVPLVMRLGRDLGAKHERVQTPAGLIDIVPTCLELAGLPAGADLHGRSLVQLAEENNYERPVFASYLAPCTDPIAFDHEWDYESLQPSPFDPYGSGECWGDGCVMVRRGDWKLINYHSGAMELFNLGTDPDETTNLWGREEYAQRVLELLQTLLCWQMETGLPDIPQEGLPYHFRSFVRRRLPERQKPHWDAWQQKADEKGI
jgi:arylsulfatase A-like enzyme